MRKLVNYLFILILFISFSTKKIIAEEISLDINSETSVQEYIITTTYYDENYNVLWNEDIITTKEKAYEIQRQRLNNSALQLVNNQSININRDTGWPVYYETNSKVIYLDYYKSTIVPGYTFINTRLAWLTVPYIKQYDVIAVRWDGTASLTKAIGSQKVTNNPLQITNYSYNGNNMVVKTNGVGISMNLYDSGYYHNLELTAKILPSNVTKVYASYQHAITNNITLTESKSYNLNSAGLGGVINFTTSTITNKYDGMSGVNYTGLRTLNGAPDI